MGLATAQVWLDLLVYLIFNISSQHDRVKLQKKMRDIPTTPFSLLSPTNLLLVGTTSLSCESVSCKNSVFHQDILIR